MRCSSRRLAFLAAVAVASQVFAHTTVYTAVLSGPAESPPNNSPGTGFAIVTLDADLALMRVQAQFSGLTGNTTLAHIHGPTTTPGAGLASVATQQPSFTGFPLGVTSGTMDTTFDMTLASSYSSGFITNNGGTVGGAYAAFQTGLEQGRMYFNIHTSTFGGGEIRGFLVPEPSTLALLTLAPVALLRRRK